MKTLSKWTLLVASLAGPGVGVAAGRDHVWIEGEAPASINLKPNVAGWGRKEFLSGEKWLHVAIDADKVA